MWIEAFGIEPVLPEEPDPRDMLLEDVVDEIGIPSRAYYCLKRAGFKNLGDIADATSEELLNIRNFGKKALQQIEDVLSCYGLALNGEVCM